LSNVSSTCYQTMNSMRQQISVI